MQEPSRVIDYSFFLKIGWSNFKPTEARTSIMEQFVTVVFCILLVVIIFKPLPTCVLFVKLKL